MEETILLFIQFGLELIRIWIGTRFIFGCQITKKWFVALVYGIFCIVLFAGWIPTTDMGMIMWGIIILLYFVTIKMPVSKDWRWKIFYGFILLYQEELLCIVVGDTLFFLWDDIKMEEQDVINSLISLLFVAIVGCLYKKNKNSHEDKGIMRYLRKMIIPMLVFVTVEIMLVIVFLNYLLKISQNERAYIMGMVLCILSMISIGILFATVSYVKYSNEKMEQMLKIEQRMNKLEIQHFETLLEREEATKRYRHDVINHLAFVKEMLCSGAIEEAENYISNMLSHIEHIRNCNYDTGNKLMNIILNYYVTQLDECVEVSVKGGWKKEVCASDYDISTIVSNLLRNAVEAIQVCGQSTPMLCVEFGTGDMYLRISIKNSMKSAGVQYDQYGNVLTTKEDKENHGMGLKNVKEIIQKNKGVFNYSVSENEFYCVVSLRIKEEKINR